MSGQSHPTISMFEARAELLDIQQSNMGLDDAIGLLAAWMSQSGHKLSEDDIAILNDVGGVLYREGLRRRAS